MKKRKRITERQRFGRLLSFVESHLGFRVTLIETTKPQLWGRAYLFKRRPCKIVVGLLPEKKMRGVHWQRACATLIHEVGHCALRYISHSEREAWAWGRRAVPTQCFPRKVWKEFSRECLNSYPRAMRDERRCGAFGRWWVWK